MKHFTLSLVMIVAGTLALQSSASAQFDPRPANLLNSHHLTTLTAFDGTLAPEPVAAPAAKDVLSANHADIASPEPAAPAVVYADLDPALKMAAISGNLSVPEDQPVVLNFIPMLPHPNLVIDMGGTPGSSAGSGSQADSGSPSDMSGTGGTQYYGYQQPQAGVQYSQPYVQPYVQPTYVQTDSPSKAVVKKSSASASSDHESDIVASETDTAPMPSRYAASTYSVGANINLFGLSLIILAVVALIAFAGEYQHRKNAQVRTAAHA